MKLCGFDVGLQRPLFLIAGPCVVESEQLQLDVAGRLQETALVVGRNGGQEGAVGDDLLEDRGRGAETGEELGVWCGHGKKVTGCPPQPIPL